MERQTERLLRQRVRELEEREQELMATINELGFAGMEIRAEDVGQLADYKKQNTELMAFVQEVADSKSKYGKTARRLLGQ